MRNGGELTLAKKPVFLKEIHRKAAEKFQIGSPSSPELL